MDWLADGPVPSVLVERDAVPGAAGTPMESVTTDHALGARHIAEPERPVHRVQVSPRLNVRASTGAPRA